MPRLSTGTALAREFKTYRGSEHKLRELLGCPEGDGDLEWAELRQDPTLLERQVAQRIGELVLMDGQEDEPESAPTPIKAASKRTTPEPADATVPNP